MWEASIMARFFLTFDPSTCFLDTMKTPSPTILCSDDGRGKRRLTSHGGTLLFSTFCRCLKGLSQPPKTKHQKLTQSSRGIVRLTVEWFLRRENNRWLGWKRISPSIPVFSMEGKMAVEHLGALGTMGETAHRR